MPLYIKLDVGRSGLIGAWVSKRPDEFVGDSTACAKSVPQVLRKLAKTIPLPKPAEVPK